MDDKIINKLKQLTKKAINNDEVPIAALIVKNNEIISYAYNKVKKNNSVLNHAEILAIEKASKKINNWRLNDCELYVTLEPCSMCKEIIKKSRIKRVVYFVSQNNYETEKDPEYSFYNNNYFKNELKDFFKNKRKNK